MWNKYQNKISKFIDEIRSNHRNVQLQYQDQLSLVQLLKMFQDDIFIPITRWSLPPRELLHICNDIRLNKRKKIVEFGTGYSTIFISKLLEINNMNIEFISVDSDLNWQNAIFETLSKLKLSDKVNLKFAPITGIEDSISHLKQTSWFDTKVLGNALKSMCDIDLVIVDAPHGGECPYSRYTAIPFLKNQLSANFSIFLDNTNRIEEHEIARLWQDDLNCSIIDHATYCYLSSNTSMITAPYGVNPKGWR